MDVNRKRAGPAASAGPAGGADPRGRAPAVSDAQSTSSAPPAAAPLYAERGPQPSIPARVEVDPRRRGFLRAAAGAGALGTLAALSGETAAAPAAAAAAPVEPAQPKGYHETDHIRKYYATARYW